jgi:hypothetical protein
MTRRNLIPALLGFAALSFGQTDALPKAETILDHYLEVTGGKSAYEKRKNEIITGTLEVKAQGLKGSIKRYSAEPAQEYSVIEIEGVGKIEAGMNNGVAWEKSMIMGSRIKSGEEKAQAVREGTFNASLHWRDQYPTVETIGTETIDGELCYKVLMTPKEGKPETMYFQKKSGLAVKTTTVAVTQMGEVPSEVVILEYKSFGGVTVPAKIAQKAGGMEMILTFDDVKTNQPMPPDRFEPPAEVKALINKPAADKKQ